MPTTTGPMIVQSIVARTIAKKVISIMELSTVTPLYSSADRVAVCRSSLRNAFARIAAKWIEASINGAMMRKASNEAIK